jgi:hypothetical protein
LRGICGFWGNSPNDERKEDLRPGEPSSKRFAGTLVRRGEAQEPPEATRLLAKLRGEKLASLVGVPETLVGIEGEPLPALGQIPML